MANSFPTRLFAIMQTHPENKVSSRISESKWSRMQMSKKTVKSTFALEILLAAAVCVAGTGTVDVKTTQLCDLNMLFYLE